MDASAEKVEESWGGCSYQYVARSCAHTVIHEFQVPCFGQGYKQKKCSYLRWDFSQDGGLLVALCLVT